MVLIFKRNSVQRSNPNFQRFILADDDTWVLKKNFQRSVPYWKWSKKEEEEKEEAAINNKKRKNDEYLPLILRNHLYHDHLLTSN